ncbi:hypothetical protein PGTUg99_003562 [Puccinia graminis f. sp. tritici]|uniref:Uncharacterized protein n=2 Tax=Puccinia graminis f. sp. tritici TaxID=56615 RepID=E3JX13_PUCGT|nr:uncharacterized protein PGTG_02049 [Puccinia graminis f. sp. tritici CRL 75-36-700-3]EFP76588.1 hypothetical protein PGTG_02049 [Puccinia graminis f. sp. tritici CRL 75-36-700-3]KAA1111326.1 hypothetical protein PGTUg99_003562 [Puccinia graminis f. sp. tritici]
MNTNNTLAPAGTPSRSSVTPKSQLTDQASTDDQVPSPTSPEIELPSLIFAIPFPRAVEGYQATKETPPFLLYTFPRSVYEKPPKDPVTGKRNEKLLKKVERKWQEEVKEGEDIKRGEVKEAGVWPRFKGALIRDAAAAIKYMPSNAMEALARLPPKTKLGKLTIVYPVSTNSSHVIDVNYQGENEIEENFLNLLYKARKKARTQTLISGCLLPLTLAIDVFVVVPLFLFEINLAYFSVQVSGVQKAGLLSDFEKKKTTKHVSDRSSHRRNDEITTDECPEEDERARSPFDFEVAKPGTFDRTIEHLYNICSELDPLKFPLKDSLPMPTYLPSKDIATTLVEIFKESLPQEVMTRHVLDEQLAAEDLDRALRKAAKEYVNSIKGINESNTCAIQEFFARKY